MARILFLTHRVPFPPDRGDRIRSSRFLRHLAARHEVSLAAVHEGPLDPASVRALEAVCVSIDVGVVTPLRVRAAALGALFTRSALTPRSFWSPQLARRVDALVRRGRYDLFFVYCSSMAPYALRHRDVPMLVDLVDADSEKWSERASYATLPSRLLYRREAWRLRRFERTVALAAARVLVTSEREAAIVRSIAPAAGVTVVPNGVDLPVDASAPRDLPTLVFTGVMDYWPNVDACERLVRDVLPAVRREIPSAEVIIVGQRPNAAVRRLASLPGVTVTGAVGDVAPYLRSAAVFVAPLRIARGIQNKILEAMAARLPVVCSEPAAAGLDAVPGRDLVVADGPAATAGAIVALLRDAAARVRLGAAARAFVAAHHTWDDHLARLDDVVRDVADRPSSSRCAPSR
jgi:sugar transferase (PEP-CTERM/EpsH1 system associated)